MLVKKDKNLGFSLIEVIIAITLLIALMAVAITMTVGGIKSAKTNQVIADLKTLGSQKNGEISNNLTNELKRFASDQSLVGSINPSLPTNGYFDLLNESGCIVRKTSFVDSPTKDIPIDPSKGQKFPAAGIRGDTGQGETGENNIDCSKATFGIPSLSLTPRYRRQWAIAKDKPLAGDKTIAVIIIDLASNKIVRQEVLIKTDGK